MKQCSKCHQTYSDDTLNFCLTDGNPLASDSSFEETLIRPSPFVQPTEQPTKQGVSPLFAYFCVALLALIAGGGIVFFLKPNNEPILVSSSKIENSTSEVENSSSLPNPINSPSSPNPILKKEFDVEGIWMGNHNGVPATLIFNRTENNKYSATLSRGTFRIAIEAQIVPDTKDVFFEEKSVIKGKGWGVLGTSKGTISDDGKKMIGGGKDEHGIAYAWSFSKR